MIVKAPSGWRLRQVGERSQPGDLIWSRYKYTGRDSSGVPRFAPLELWQWTPIEGFNTGKCPSGLHPVACPGDVVRETEWEPARAEDFVGSLLVLNSDGTIFVDPEN